MTTTPEPTRSDPPVSGDVVYRHSVFTRLWHWTNAVTFVILLMSGLMIFNAHPRLYWGSFGADPDPAWLEIGSVETEGYLRVGETQFTTTGVLGLSKNDAGETQAVAFPRWSTIPSRYNLSVARQWHLTFAWVLSVGIAVYLIGSLINRHVAHDLIPRARELTPRNVWRDIRHHATLNLPKGRAALRYGVLQKLTYLVVLFILFPGMILTGMTMSPSLDATFPVLLDLFGGRQSARSLHFIFAFGLVAFVVIHLLMVLLAGPLNELRSIITGTFRLPKEKDTS